MTPYRSLLYTTLVLILCLAFFELTPVDVWIQQALYNADAQQWWYHDPSKLMQFIFYDGIKRLLIIFALCILISLIFFRKKKIIADYSQGLFIVFLSLIIVPSVVGLLKSTTNVACPKDTDLFSGPHPYVMVFESYPEGRRPDEKQRCFPAGHASGGFALMSLYFLFKEKRNRNRGLLTGLTVGWLMGNYKMMIGDHFLSHTVITMVLAWWLINIIVLLMSSLKKLKPSFLGSKTL